MSPERWQKIEDVFQSVVDLAPEERLSYLNKNYADDTDLIAEIDLAAKAIDTNRTAFIEEAIKARLHTAKTYVAMDKGPPKKTSLLPVGTISREGKITIKPARGRPDSAKRVRGYAIDGSPIF